MEYVQNVSIIMTAIILETGTVLNPPSNVIEDYTTDLRYNYHRILFRTINLEIFIILCALFDYHVCHNESSTRHILFFLTTKS